MIFLYAVSRLRRYT